MTENNSDVYYVLQVMSGRENRVLEDLEGRKRAEEANGVDMSWLQEIRIPTFMTLVPNGHGQRKKTKKYPGYVFVKANLTDEANRPIPYRWQFVSERGGGVLRNLGLAVGFVLEDEEEEAKNANPIWKIGETVLIKDGPFVNIEGTIETLDEERQIMGLSVKIFGRSTITQVSYWQVERPL